MSRYIPNTNADIQKMLGRIDVSSIEDLYVDIPREIRLERDLNLPRPMCELELLSHMEELANKNETTKENTCFLGAGAYDHHIPSVVGHIVGRSEFYTSYTPYQPEVSQGTLQAMFEYQTMICELTGMHAANASVYDGATAIAEAAKMACGIKSRQEILVSKAVHPHSRAVLRTYARFNGIDVVEFDYDDGRVSIEDLEAKLSSDTAAVIMQTPNFFGILEDLGEIGDLVHKQGALFIVSVDPISLSLIKPPGEYGADIVVGEGQSLGNPLSFGGPYVGFFATTKRLTRRMPGRIVGETVDADGRRGYVLTLQTREQHIRREKATSNICSNQSLNALIAAVYMAVMGREGLREVGNLCVQKAHYAYDRLLEIDGVESVFGAPFFKEFIVDVNRPIHELNRALLDYAIIGGYDVGKDYPELEGGWLIAVTEKRTKSEIDMLAEKVGELL